MNKKVRVAAFVSPGLYRLAKAKAILEGKTISAVVEALLKKYGEDYKV